ncbi:MAG: metallophosphoesterase, partial [Planctomycetota bacterium]
MPLAIRKLSLLLAVALAAQAAAQKPGDPPVVTGRVFIDADSNGRFSSGDTPVAAAAVSDGLQIVRTDAQGRYRIQPKRDPLLAETADPIVRLSIPSGTWPRKHWWALVRANGPQAVVDFPLRIAKQALPLRFIHATDAHVSSGRWAHFAAFKRQLARQEKQAAFCVLTGDQWHVIDRYGPEKAIATAARYQTVARNFPIPLFTVPGNHDLAGTNSGKDWSTHAHLKDFELYRKHCGPLRWSFTWGGVHVIGIESMKRNPFVKGAYTFGLSQTSRAWLTAELDRLPPGTRELLFMHYPVEAKLLTELASKYNIAAGFA